MSRTDQPGPPANDPLPLRKWEQTAASASTNRPLMAVVFLLSLIVAIIGLWAGQTLLYGLASWVGGVVFAVGVAEARRGRQARR